MLIIKKLKKHISEKLKVEGIFFIVERFIVLMPNNFQLIIYSLYPFVFYLII